MIYLYRVLAMLSAPIYLMTVFFSKKTRAFLTKRPSSFEINTKNNKPLWVHASSGEFEHAKFLIKSLKEKYPHKKIVVTYSSPSYFYSIEKDKNIDAYLPLPLDLKAPIISIIRKINPEAVLFARTDVWPELAHQLKKREIPSLVFARAESGNINFFKTLNYQMTFLKTQHLSFVSERDKGRFISSVGKKAHSIKMSVDGDPRIDEAFDKIESRGYKSINPESDTTIVLGSVWKEDLKVIAPIISKAIKKGLLTKVIAVPHDPTKDHIAEIKAAFKGFPISLYSANPSMNTTVSIIDQVGLLFDLYSEAGVAFVGGSFKSKVHSVIEPLSYGLPVLTGPFVKNNSEALTYSKKPYEFVKVSTNENEFFKNLKTALNDNKFEIKETIEMQKGSSQKIIDHLSGLI